jgi:DNA polymerase III delta subunit
MNYLQFLSHKDEARKKHVFMVGGPERVLVDDVVRQLTGLIGVEAHNIQRIQCPAKPSDIDSALNQFAPGRRIVVLSDVQKLKSTDSISGWITNTAQDKTRPVVLICTADAVRPEHGAERFIPTNKAVVYIDCNSITDENVGVFVSSLAGVDESVGELIGRRCGGDVRAITNETAKLALFDNIDMKLVDELVPPSVDEDVVDALVENRRKDVLIMDTSKLEPRRFITTMTNRLLQLLHLYLLKGRGLNGRDLVQRTSIPPFLIGRRLDQVRCISLEDTFRRLQVLLQAEDQIRNGNTIGILESILIQW